ncbi:hypothetical protein GMOD_00003413 [Pyrenophora seminiperda CCB06]|uniref:Uncharacterized protein n=1 Tax=Pyrenophora seminiperda CCB06 TaxID=1302712 RepID=A0A3M7MJ42_9PLEO|nr:hypothetical protein GMOD_00003413 [Pyrenophora seminiperda CCB06]
MGRRCLVERRQGPKGHRQVRLLSQYPRTVRWAAARQARLDAITARLGGAADASGLVCQPGATQIPALVLMRQLNDRLLVRLQAAAGMDWVTRARGSGHSTDACRACEPKQRTGSFRCGGDVPLGEGSSQAPCALPAPPYF